ncbi:Sphingolipid C4-hydroxylase SUR2 [Ceratocystis lukuohia]|uniref:Sphingolipid C4-hydroxylase SUR2 n=1 Tax=Ceratocystis lukuohia TaxID=2019550 RepID=A0ABR4MJC5_9PEZI
MALPNATLLDELPPLPEYTLKPLPDLFPGIVNDVTLVAILPVLVYWITSMFFHFIDVYDFWAQYRIHTPEEITSRNKVSRYEVARDTIMQQIIQMATSILLSVTEDAPTYGREEYDVAVWAQRLRRAQRGFPLLLNLLGLNAADISANMAQSHPLLAGVLAGGHYPSLTTQLNSHTVPTFAAWELLVGRLIYYVLVPALQFVVAVVWVDTWQYFLHRLMHNNRWMYNTFHSRHHRLYVPYAYGALYNHPVEGFLLDTLGAGIAYLVAGMTQRQGMVFFSFSTIKTVDDHCGYSLPWDPLQHISSNNAEYHDIHHQNWGIKTNFSQPFFTFWDKLLDTRYTGTRHIEQRMRVREAFEKKKQQQQQQHEKKEHHHRPRQEQQQEEQERGHDQRNLRLRRQSQQPLASDLGLLKRHQSSGQTQTCGHSCGQSTTLQPAVVSVSSQR